MPSSPSWRAGSDAPVSAVCNRGPYRRRSDVNGEIRAHPTIDQGEFLESTDPLRRRRTARAPWRHGQRPMRPASQPAPGSPATAGQTGYFDVGRWSGRRNEALRTGRRRFEHTLDHQRVKMDAGVERRPTALNRRHRTAATHDAVLACAAAFEGEQSAREHRQYGSAQGVLVGELVT